ncbi:MAG: lysophospholipid acyltransferase family protein [Pseudomonadales bacterium]
MQRQKNWRYYLFQPYKWLVFGPLLVLSMLLAAVFIVLFGRWCPRFCNQKLAPGWCSLNTLTALSSVDVSGQHRIDPGQSYIIVANHLSHFDIFLLYGRLGLDIRWVMKQELRSLPFFGVAAEKLGHIYIDRSDRDKAHAQLKAAQQKFSSGSSIIFFPEGTRSEGGALLPFKSGAFVMAKQMQLPILPVVLSGTDAVAPPRSLDLYPGKTVMTVLEPIPADDVINMNHEELKERARNAIQLAQQSTT